MRHLLLTVLTALTLLNLPAHADPKTIADLDATTAVADGDLVAIWDISQTGASKTRKVAFSDFRFSLLSGLTLTGTSGSTLNIGTGGTLGTAAFTAASAYDVAGAAAAITKTSLGLALVENTALSTWAGTSNLITLGTVTTGTWHATAIGDTYISSAATWNAKEPALGNPGSNGYLLSSTTGGTRSWVAPPAAFDPAAITVTLTSNAATLANVTHGGDVVLIQNNGATWLRFGDGGTVAVLAADLYLNSSTNVLRWADGVQIANVSAANSIEVVGTAPTGVILTSPDGTRYKIGVANGGTITVGAP